MVLYLPNKSGNQVSVTVPRYIEGVLFRRRGGEDVARIFCIGPYRYRLRGYNPQRPAYGIRADIEALNNWASRYFCPLEDIVFHEERKNYYADFTLYDPVAQQFEKHGLIKEA